MAAQLTGWRLDIKSESSIESKLAGAKYVLATIEGLDEFRVELLVQEGYSTPDQVAELSPRALNRILNLDEEEALTLIESAKDVAKEFSQGNFRLMFLKGEDSDEAENSFAAPDVEEKVSKNSADFDERVELFMSLSGVGEAAAHALAEGGYGTIGDIVADSADEVAEKTGLSLGVARTVQLAADRFLQS